MAKPCTVTFTGLNGLRHSVDLEADSVHEAAVLALQAFKKSSFVDLAPGLATRLQVSVREPLVTHEVSVVKLRQWVAQGSVNPNEVSKRQRLKAILEACLLKAG